MEEEHPSNAAELVISRGRRSTVTRGRLHFTFHYTVQSPGNIRNRPRLLLKGQGARRCREG